MMTEQPVHVVANFTVQDAAKYREYEKGFFPILKKHGGEFIARGGKFVQLEGRERPRNVVAKFPSVDAAVNCYHSTEYQAALAHAKGASERELMVVETTD